MDGWETTFCDTTYFHVLLLLVSGRVPTYNPVVIPFCWEISPPKKNHPAKKKPHRIQGIPNYLLHPRGRYFLFILNSSGFDFQVSPGIFSFFLLKVRVVFSRPKAYRKTPWVAYKPSDHKAASYFWGGGYFFGGGKVDQ